MKRNVDRTPIAEQIARSQRRASETWNKCQECGKFIPHKDIADGKAVRRILEPDSYLGSEKYETLCRDHKD